MDDTPVDQAEDITAAADTALDAAETGIVPDASPTQMAELAWSTDGPDYTRQWSPIRDTEPAWLSDAADDEPDAKNRHALLLWCLAVAAVLITAVAAGWFSNVFYHEEQSTPPGKSSPEPPQTTSPTAAPQPPPKTPAAAPPPPTVTELLPPPVTVTATPPTTAAPSTPTLPNPPANAYDTYVQLLARDGLIATDSREEMHDEAYWICLATRNGETAAIDRLVEESEQKSPTLSPAEVRGTLADAVEAYCPEFVNGYR